MLAEALTRVLDEPAEALAKGLPPTPEPLTISTVGKYGWHVLEGDLFLPVLLLKESSLAHNLAVMASYCREHGVDLAPHGKTTMAPQLFARQLAAGAWGMTAATPSQVRVYRHFGIGRVILANELVEPGAIRWLSEELDRDPEFDFYCLVDSPAAVAALADARSGQRRRPLQVLVELGIQGGRTGCRSREDALALADLAVRSPELELAGVEGFEGIIHAERQSDTLAAVDAFVASLRQLAETAAAVGAFASRREVLVTVGGSAYFDRIVAGLRDLDLGVPVRIVLRSGCYLTHDSGLYEQVSPLGARGHGRRLEPALEAWGVVLSRPEPELGIVGMGKRDVPYDLGLPIPFRVHGTHGARDVAGVMEAFAIDDQHLYVRLPATDPLGVGDLLGLGISHPCTAFDKWRLIPVVDDDYRVISAVRTFF